MAIAPLRATKPARESRLAVTDVDQIRPAEEARRQRAIEEANKAIESGEKMIRSFV